MYRTTVMVNKDEYNNERLRSRYCTVEANYRQTQSRGLSATAQLLVLFSINMLEK